MPTKKPHHSSAPGSSLFSLHVKACLMDDITMLAQRRDVAEQTPNKRSGRDGAGGYQEAIEKNSEYFDPVRHLRTAALITEHKEAMDSLFTSGSRFRNPNVRAPTISNDNLHLILPDDIHYEDLEHDEDETPRLPLFGDETTSDVSSKKKCGVLGLGCGRMFKFKFKSIKKKHEAEKRAPEVKFGVTI